MDDFMDIFTEEFNKYSLNIHVYTVVGDQAGEVLIGHSEFLYESVLVDRMYNIIHFFKEGFGYIVDYNINTDTESKTYDLTLYLKNTPEDEGKEDPIDPPEE